MNEDAKDLFEHVIKDFFTLRLEWRLYRSFWGTNKETFDFLKSISATTSQMLETIVFERVLLGLRKLTDHPGSERRERRTVTMRALPKYFDDEDKSLQKLVTRFVTSADAARNWSDKKIAHSDFKFRQGDYSLKSISRENIESALDRGSDVICWISHNHFNVTQGTHPMTGAEDERAFLKCLYHGKKAMEQKNQLYRELHEKREYAKLRALYEIPAWLERKDPPFNA